MQVNDVKVSHNNLTLLYYVIIIVTWYWSYLDNHFNMILMVLTLHITSHFGPTGPFPKHGGLSLVRSIKHSDSFKMLHFWCKLFMELSAVEPGLHAEVVPSPWSFVWALIFCSFMIQFNLSWTSFISSCLLINCGCGRCSNNRCGVRSLIKAGP